MTETLSKTFMERRFGASASDVSTALVAAGHEAHVRSLEAKVGSRLKSNHAYGGTFWLALPEEVVARLLPLLEDATRYAPEGSQYELVVWDGIVILPVKAIDGAARNGRMRAHTSHLRARLTSVNIPEPPEPTLLDDLADFGSNDFEQVALAAVERARKALGDITTTTIVAAYECNASSGLQVVEVGLATLDEDGFIHFSDSQQLSIIDPPATPTRPKLVAGEKFDDAPRPAPILDLVEQATTAAGEDQSDRQVGAPEAE